MEHRRSSTQIIPIVIGDEKDTLALSAWLEEHGILATAIRPPTVGQGQSRIRLTLSAAHTDQHIKCVIEALKKWRDQHGT